MSLDSRLQSQPFARWELPSIEDPSAPDLAPSVESTVTATDAVEDTDQDHENIHSDPVIDPDELAALRASASEEGYADGYRDGVAKAESDIAERLTVLTNLAEALTAPLEALDHDIETLLLHMVTDIARHLVRRELSTQPEQIVSVLREALSMLPINHREICIQLHPEDAHLVEELLHLEDRPWHIEENPLLSRGGCWVSTEVSQIDATVENRIGEIIARVLGDQRRDSNQT
jgi:flagellar assembly protein FliH